MNSTNSLEAFFPRDIRHDAFKYLPKVKKFLEEKREIKKDSPLLVKALHISAQADWPLGLSNKELIKDLDNLILDRLK